jgi:hypothetical protein
MATRFRLAVDLDLSSVTRRDKIVKILTSKTYIFCCKSIQNSKTQALNINIRTNYDLKTEESVITKYR